jgi:hypothetical protein
VKVYNKLVLDMEDWSVLEEDSYEYVGPVVECAGGMLTKQADFLTARYLNDVNDAASGGVIVTVPSGVQSPAVSQTQPGDRIVLDDPTAFALSDTVNAQQLFGGIYQYMQTYVSSTASPAIGTCAFYLAADISSTTYTYRVTADAKPTTAIPTFIAGVFINAITKGNYGWIQIAGIVSVLFDSTITGAGTVGYPVSVKILATVPSTFDVGVPLAASLVGGIATVSTSAGVAITAVTLSTISQVLWTRTPFPRI